MNWTENGIIKQTLPSVFGTGRIYTKFVRGSIYDLALSRWHLRMNDKTKQNQFFPHWTWCREVPQLWQNHPSIDLATRKGIISRRLAIDLEPVTSTFLWDPLPTKYKKKSIRDRCEFAKSTFSGAEEWAAREQLNEIVCAAHLLPLCAPVIFSVKGSKISIREKYTVTKYQRFGR